VNFNVTESKGGEKEGMYEDVEIQLRKQPSIHTESPTLTKKIPYPGNKE
jgi:hypothetical protein